MTFTKFLSFCRFLALIASGVQPQKVEVFGGYQYLRPDSGPNLNGWNAALTGNFKHLGITADFSGTYGGGGSIQTVLAAPKVARCTNDLISGKSR
jgi:hypothetical protein